MDQDSPSYLLEDQYGYQLRRAVQRYQGIFARLIPDLTTMQFASLVRLDQSGAMSQNLLGRVASMDAATVKGVVMRLQALGLVRRLADPTDKRRLTVEITDEGRALVRRMYDPAVQAMEVALAPLSPSERVTLMALLSRLTG
ncbi:MarR family winged helix-turn-helix transcriptional regulator [Gemmobacter serpentinus]|uniref:MarR family winged helix-turn-helix transcriptional regulator n=1 Tax=Gemmobacter serpentinus TaxID=2652247 RepID=UPI00124C9B27|nr:MarR family transcriptional regulator [Gemmobacter serpentinus]